LEYQGGKNQKGRKAEEGQTLKKGVNQRNPTGINEAEHW